RFCSQRTARSRVRRSSCCCSLGDVERRALARRRPEGRRSEGWHSNNFAEPARANHLHRATRVGRGTATSPELWKLIQEEVECVHAWLSGASVLFVCSPFR